MVKIGDPFFRVILAVVLAPLSAWGNPYADTAWPVAKHDANGTASLATELRRYPDWKQACTCARTPVVAADGTVVSYGQGNSALIRAHSEMDGAILWEFNFGYGASFGGEMAVGANGVVYVPAQDENLIALNVSTGEMLWNRSISTGVPGDWVGSVTIGTAGEIYTTKRLSGTHFALDPLTGGDIWTYIPIGSTYSALTVGDDGRLYGVSATRLFAINAAGGSIWSVAQPGGGVRGGVVLADDADALYFGTQNNPYLLLAYRRSDGGYLWGYAAGSAILDTPSIFGDTVIASSRQPFTVFSVARADGSLRWSRALGSPTPIVLTSPAIARVDDTDIVYVVTANDLLVLNAETGVPHWPTLITSSYDSIKSPSIAPDGSIYYCAESALHRVVPYPMPYLDYRGHTVPESAASTDVVIWRGGRNTTATFSVDVSFVDGTATGGGVDYTAVPQTVIFSPFETSKIITIPITQDAVDEGPETFTVILSNMVVLAGGIDGWIASAPWNTTTVTISAPLANGPYGNSSWPVPKGDANGTSNLATAVRRYPGWSNGHGCRRTPVIAAENNIVISSGADTFLRAQSDVDGAVIWEFDVGGQVPESNEIGELALGGNGVVFVPGNYGSLLAINVSNGVLLWNCSFSSPLDTKWDIKDVTVGNNGDVYASYLGSKAFHAVDPLTGAVKWTHNLPDGADSALTVGSDGMLYGKMCGYDLALKPDGNVLWTSPMYGCVWGAVVLAPDADAMFYATAQGSLNAVRRSDGGLLWQHSTSVFTLFTPIVYRDTVIIGTANAGVHCVARADGSVRWISTEAGSFTGTPTVGSIEGVDVIYISAHTAGLLTALNPETGAVLWSFSMDAGVFRSQSLAPDGSLYVCDTNTLHHVNPLSIVHIEERNYTVLESALGVNVTLVRDGMNTSTSFTVVLSCTDGTATGGGVDYTSAPQTVTFPANEAVVVVTVPINRDSVSEGPETFTVSLSEMTVISGPQAWIADAPFNHSTVTIEDSPSVAISAAPPAAPVVSFVADPITIVHIAASSPFESSRVYTCAPDGASGVAAVTGVIGPPTTVTCTLAYPTGERHDGVFNVTLLEDGFPVTLDTSGSGGMPAQARFVQRYAGAAPLAPNIGVPLSLAVTGDGFASGPAAYECNLTAANANATITATSVVYGSTNLITCNFDAADTDLIGVQGATLSIKETSPLSQVVAASSVVTVTFVAQPVSAPTGPPASASVSATSFPDLGLVKLTWTQPSLALSGNLIPTVYTVYRDGVPLGTVSAPTLSYTDTTALENTAYTYSLSFNNTLGASPVSTGTVATTPFSRPAVATVNPPAVPSAGALLVTVTGAHFGASASELLHVTIGGIVNATITSWTSSSSFVFLAPSIAVATGVPVVVYTIHGSSTPSGSIDFAPAPVVLSVDPTTGGRVEGRFVEISGADFGSSAADIDGITLAGTPCTGIVWVNSTFVTCIAGVAPTVFTGAVVVSTKAGGFGAFFLAPSYAYTGPQVSAVNPGALDGAGATGGAVITLHGAHLGLDRAGGAADLLAINITETLTTSGFDVPCAPFARAGATEATCTFPAAGLPEGTYSFTVATGTGGQVQSSATLIVGASNSTATPSPTPSVIPSAAPVPVPVILAVFPGTFPAGQSTQITITGSNFGSGPGEVTSVTIAGQVCTPVVWISSTEVTCTVSPPSPSTGPVVMETTSGGVGTSTATFSSTPASGGSAPIIVSITPEMHPLTGGTNVTIVAEMLETLVHVTFSVGSGGDDSFSTTTTRLRDRALTLSQQQGYSAVTVQGNVTTTYEASSQQYTAVVTVPAAPGTQETYADLTVINPAVAKSTSATNAIYYTDLKCAAGSEYPVGSECRPCPTGAVCPGGNRVWPEPGYWNPGEDAGYVMKCRPESRCIGGVDSACAAGYAGDLCGECAAGFIRAPSGACNPCPAQASRLIFLIGDVVVWCLVAFTAWASQSNENLQRVVDVVIVLQSAAGFASLMNEKFPSWIVAIYDTFYIFMGNYDIFKTDCYGNSTSAFEQRFVSQLVYGVAIGALMVIGVPLIGILRLALTKNTDLDRKTFVKQYTYDRCVRCFSTWCQIIFMNWTRRALEAVYCLPFPDGTTRLASFPTVHCFKGSHTIVFAISCAILLGLTIGWPLLYSLLVVRGRSTEELYGEPRVMHRWGNGYILLKPSQRYFYLNFYFTATCVSAAYVVFADNPIARLCLAGGAIGIEVLAIARASPHTKGRDDWVQLSYDIPMAMLVAVTSAAEMGTLSATTIYILALVALAMITFCFLFHFGDLIMHLIGADPDDYELGVPDRFREHGDDISASLDDSDDRAKDDGLLGPTGLPNAVAMRQRRRSVFEDVGVALGFMDEDDIVGEEDVDVDANGQPPEPADDRSFMTIAMEMLGFGDVEGLADDEQRLQEMQENGHHQHDAGLVPTSSLTRAPPAYDEGWLPVSPPIETGQNQDANASAR